MQVISTRVLWEFWGKHPRSKRPLSAWHKLVSKADWQGPADIKTAFGTNVHFVGDDKVIFDTGMKYRLTVSVSYHPYHRVLMTAVGTHHQIDAETV